MDELKWQQWQPSLRRVGEIWIAMSEYRRDNDIGGSGEGAREIHVRAKFGLSACNMNYSKALL
jgi:hypothetical protein